jgi:hypothetical protein
MGVALRNTNPALLLNQTPAQSVINGQPNFKAGLNADDTGTFNFNLVAGVPWVLGVHKSIDSTGGVGVLVANEVLDDSNGASALGMAFGNLIDGNASYYGPASAYGILGYINANNEAYISGTIPIYANVNISGGSIVDTAIGISTSILCSNYLGASTIDVAKGISIEINNISSTINTAYGIKIQDINTATNNYAIQTGAGKVEFGDTIKATGYKSSDGSAGITTTITTASLVGKTITIKNGLITGFS